MKVNCSNFVSEFVKFTATHSGGTEYKFLYKLSPCKTKIILPGFHCHIYSTLLDSFGIELFNRKTPIFVCSW